MKNYSVQEINEYLKGQIEGATSQKISSPEQMEAAHADQITFIGHKKFEKNWAESKASVAIVNRDISIEPGNGRAFIKVDNAELAMCRVLELFSPELPVFDSEVHTTAVVHPSAILGKNVKIGAGAYIGPNTTIADGVVIYPNVTILDGCTIGANSIIWPGAVIRERCHIGKGTILHPNVTIGADGFGFQKCPERGLAKVPHIGNVVIGNYVEIGAGSCVDRAKFNSTIVGDGCKIDNLVQIGHNCVLGMFCIMAGNSGLAGSVTLGNGVVIGGSASIRDHVTLGDGVTVGAGSGVTCSIPAGDTVLGYPAVEARLALRQWAALKRLVTK